MSGETGAQRIVLSTRKNAQAPGKRAASIALNSVPKGKGGRLGEEGRRALARFAGVVVRKDLFGGNTGGLIGKARGSARPDRSMRARLRTGLDWPAGLGKASGAFPRMAARLGPQTLGWNNGGANPAREWARLPGNRPNSIFQWNCIGILGHPFLGKGGQGSRDAVRRLAGLWAQLSRMQDPIRKGDTGFSSPSAGHDQLRAARCREAEHGRVQVASFFLEEARRPMGRE